MLSTAQAASSTRDHVATPSTIATHGSRAMPPKNAVLFGLDDHWEDNIKADDKQDKAKSGIVGTYLCWRRSDVTPAQEAIDLVGYSQWARSRGAIPMIDLYPPTSVTLGSIAAGSQDATLKVYAEALRAWNHPFLLRLFPEMNGSWESYSPHTRGQTTAQFRKAFRHVVLLFRHYGAKKVEFVWNVYKMPTHPIESLRSLWPGAKYVNWTGIDEFDRGGAGDINAHPVTAMRATAKKIRRITHKPIVIAESGAQTSAHKAAWIRELFTGTARLGVKAVVYFNETAVQSGVSLHWRLDSSGAALAATKRVLAGTAVAWPGHNHGSLLHDEYLIAKGHW